MSGKGIQDPTSTNIVGEKRRGGEGSEEERWEKREEDEKSKKGL